MSLTCPSCGARLADHGGGLCLPVGRVLALVGGLSLAGAYFMPWFGVQSVLLTGAVLGQILSGTNDLRRLMPGAAGGEGEVLMLRALVALFPICGVLGTALALVSAAWSRVRGALDILLALLGVVPLIALVVGVSRLPPGSTLDVGIWFMGAGCAAILLGVLLDAALRARARRSDPTGAREG